jgi:hypothetical protein
MRNCLRFSKLLLPIGGALKSSAYGEQNLNQKNILIFTYRWDPEELRIWGNKILIKTISFYYL